MDENIPYETRRNSNLPWGYWMSAAGEITGDQVLVDEDGSTWASVRECLWVKRLNMAMPEELRDIDLELEFLLTFLVITQRRIIQVEEKAIDLFGDYDRARFYFWLCDRVDRWTDWGERAWQNGPRALSEYLLQLKFADERVVMPD